MQPLDWEPPVTSETTDEQRVQSIDAIRKQVYARLHDFSYRRLIDEQFSGWQEAYAHRGTGSTRVRAHDLNHLYESASPIPDEMPGPDATEFCSELQDLVVESIVEGGGYLNGWPRPSLPSIG